MLFSQFFLMADRLRNMWVHCMGVQRPPESGKEVVFMKRMMIVCLMILGLVISLCAAAIAEPEQSPEATPQAITPEILAGLWELDHVDSDGTVITAEQWISFFGEIASMEFTPDGIWIMKAGGQTEIYFYEFVDGELFAEGGKAPLSLVDGKLVFDTGSGMAMTLAKTDKPGMVPDTPVDEALLGTWVLEQLLYLPDEIPVDPSMFPMLYGIPAPTLTVVNVGFAVMQLGDNKRAFPVDEWQLQDGKLIHTENSEYGTSMVWTFVREEAATEAPTEDSQPLAADAGTNIDFLIKESQNDQIQKNIDHIDNQMEVEDAQKDLYTQQKISFIRKSENDVAKVFADAYLAMKSVDEGLAIPKAFSGASINEVLQNLKTNVELGSDSTNISTYKIGSTTFSGRSDIPESETKADRAYLQNGVLRSDASGDNKEPEETTNTSSGS